MCTSWHWGRVHVFRGCQEPAPQWHGVALQSGNCEDDTMAMPLLQPEILWIGWADRIWTHMLMQWLSSVYNSQPLDTWNWTLPNTDVILRDQAEEYLQRQMNYIAAQTNIPEGAWCNGNGDQMLGSGGWYKLSLADRTSAWKIWS